MTDARGWLDRIRGLRLPDRVRVMNVCGGHERSISQAGLRGALPRPIELIPGPGCPVCVCPEEDIYAAIQLARSGVVVAAFGDMLRVPCNAPKAEPRSLEQARAAGGNVKPVSSPEEVLALARSNPDREVVFFAAGFETTTAPVAGLVARSLQADSPEDSWPANLTLLLSGRLTWPAVAGFTTESLLAAFYSVLRQVIENRPFLDNCYGQVAKPGGNPTARAILGQVMDITDANWRGIGVIPGSGFSLKPELAALDARARFSIDPDEDRKRAGEMPPGCDCARVVLGKIYPNQCILYGRACTPRKPVGPCMVSDEGACRIWWASGVREPAEPA